MKPITIKKDVVVRILWPQIQQSPAQWQCECIVDGQRAFLENGSLSACLSQAASLQLQGARTTLILPAELSLFEKVLLPARSQRQAMQALPFVVEEHLADDIENVHLAIGARQPDGGWPVVVIEQEFMHALLDMCRACQLLPVAVFTDAEALPLLDADLCVLLHDQRVLIRTATVATAVAFEDAVTVLHLITQDAVFKKVRISHERENTQHMLLAQQLSAEFSALGDVQTQVEEHAELLSQYLQKGFSSGINLLQGPFFIRQVNAGLAWWQVAAAAAVFAWLGQVTLQATSGWYFNHGARVLEAMAENHYHALFPDARQLSNPRKRLQSRLEAGSDSLNDHSFDYMFGSSMQAFMAVPSRDGLSIKQLRYEGKRSELELEIKAATIDQLDQFKQALDKAGFQAKISSANEAEGGGINGRMQIKAGS